MSLFSGALKFNPTDPAGLFDGGSSGRSPSWNSREHIMANSKLYSEALDRGIDAKSLKRFRSIYDLRDEFKSAGTRANTENEKRYRQGLGMFGNMRANAQAWQPQTQKLDTHQYGRAMRKTISKDRKRNLSSMRAGMLGTGMMNSTMMNAGARGINEDSTMAQMKMDDKIAQYKQGQLDRQYDQSMDIGESRNQRLQDVDRQKLEWIFNKEDAQPDGDAYASTLALMVKRPKMFKSLTKTRSQKYLNALNSMSKTELGW